MPYLIDGHNVINAHPELSPEDPNDEAELVLRLRAFTGRVGKKCTVVFDKGIPGGVSRDLSTGPVKVIFASPRTNADNVIKERIRRHSNPQSITVVSGDHEVQNAARARRAMVMTNHEFVELMLEKMADSGSDDEGHDVNVPPNEVENWLQLFSGGRPD